MNKNTPTTNDEAIRLHYANNIANNSDNVTASTAPFNANTTMSSKDRIAPDGTPVNSRRYRLRMGKVKGESKAARRLRRRAVVG